MNNDAIELKTRPFRALDGSRLTIGGRVCLVAYDTRLVILYQLKSVDSRTEYRHILNINTLGILNDIGRELNRIVQDGEEALFNCIYELILKDDYKEGTSDSYGNVFKNEHNPEDYYSQKLKLEYNTGLSYQLDDDSIIELNRLARRFVLNTLFRFNRPVPLGYLYLESFLPRNIISQSIQYLKELDYIGDERERHIDYDLFQISLPQDFATEITVYGIKANDLHIGLSAKGLQHFERLHTGFGKSVFIIKQCDVNLWYDELVKDHLKKFGYEAFIQEKEEPREDIRSDMLERIRNAPFIIADLTGGRENCLYELGYAHALHKRAIITRSKEDVETKDKDGKTTWKLTFDLNQHKHSLWQDKNDEDFKKELNERIEQTIKSVEQDYFLD